MENQRPNILGALILEARTRAGITQAQLSTDCGIDYNIVTSWEKGWRRLKAEDWEACRLALGEHLNVHLATPDVLKEELLPTAEERKDGHESRPARDDHGMAKRLYELRVGRGLTGTQVARDMKLYPSHITRWESGKALPTHAQLRTLVRYYETTYEYLLEGVDNRDSYERMKQERDTLRKTLGVLKNPALLNLLAGANV